MEDNIQNIDHIGIVVNNIEEHIPYYRDVLKLSYKGIKVHEKQKIRTAIFQVGSSKTFLEVFEPTNNESPVYNFLQTRGEGFHHFCFGVKDIEEALEHVQKSGIELIHKTPFIGIKGTKVAFLHPKSTGRILTEFAELKGSKK
jgi:methylmalonyl-CoA/ethylmalonyl-CoA epimerase